MTNTNTKEMDSFFNIPSGNNSSDFFYRKSNEKAHIVLTACSCFLSVLGCLIIFASYFKWKDIRSTSRRILVFITICDMITVLSYIVALFSPDYKSISKEDKDQRCLAVGLVSTFSMTSSFLWTVSLATYLYVAIVKQDVRLADKLVIFYHILCWGIPLTVTIVAATNNAIGFDNDFVTSGWCWVKASNSGTPSTDTLLWMLLAGKGWEIMSFLIISVLYFLIRYHMWLQVQYKTAAMPRDALTLIQRANRKMIWIPLVFLLLRIWGTIRFFLYATGVHSNKTISILLLYLQGIGDCGQGWTNCILFCLFTNKVYERFRMLCSKQTSQLKKHSKRTTNHSTGRLAGVASSSACYSNSPNFNEKTPLINE